MIDEKFDAIVVGAGLAGNAAALTMAKRGVKVLQLERGEYSGSKNVQSAILSADLLEELIPDFRDDAPLERNLVEQRFWMMNDRSHIGLGYRFDAKRPTRYTVIRAHFDKWFSSKVKQAGAAVLCQTTATELARNRRGCVIGVRTDRQDGIIHADVVVLADGANGLLGARAGFRKAPKPDQVALAVKETHILPRKVVEDRLNLKGDGGVVIEAGGVIARGMTGIGFIYANKECISLGVACLLSELQKTGEIPYQLLDSFKRHPSIARLIDGSDVRDYSAHLIPKRGDKPAPRLRRSGWVAVGDAASLDGIVDFDSPSIAMISGRVAAEAVSGLKLRGDLTRAGGLSLYNKMLQMTLRESKKYEDMPGLLHADPQSFSLTYPQLVLKAMKNFTRGTPEADKSILRILPSPWSRTGGEPFRVPRVLR
ncbi:FAD-dependent monooxygenase [Bradyrhizobium sp. Tv2a-2]|uniref:FAD-dependent monooxygenase n=1 Tax=Bradyrhizobium sp. Tv2a-2 TaxID=113395 RepID=UPI0003FCF51D|nr:FAD-dependent monooxygenase [Bradyrhizobium sp. Tv2a-2]